MQTLNAGYKGISLLLGLNLDRLLVLGTLVAALSFSVFIANAVFQ